MTALVPVDTKNEASVVMLLERVHEWLSTAVERSDASEIAAVKAQIATAAEATKQLNLSKEIQLDALEMVRRAEYALGKAIRKGQSDGSIETVIDARSRAGRISTGRHPDINGVSKTPLAALVGQDDMTSNGAGIAHLIDGVSPEQFEQAIGDAKAEGNLSRANVVRKVKGQQGPTTRDQRAVLIVELAAQGLTSRQMPSRVGVTEESVRQIARDFGIEIPADRLSVGTRRINGNHVVENTATALEGLAMGVELIDLAGVDPAVASQWVDSLTESMRALNRFVRQLKEQTQ